MGTGLRRCGRCRRRRRSSGRSRFAHCPPVSRPGSLPVSVRSAMCPDPPPICVLVGADPMRARRAAAVRARWRDRRRRDIGARGRRHERRLNQGRRRRRIEARGKAQRHDDRERTRRQQRFHPRPLLSRWPSGCTRVTRKRRKSSSLRRFSTGTERMLRAWRWSIQAQAQVPAEATLSLRRHQSALGPLAPPCMVAMLLHAVL